MATKFTNNEATIFHQLLNGGNFEEIFEVEKERINSTGYYCSDEQAQKYKDREIEGLLKMKRFFDKIKFFDEPEVYRVDPWGYGQTNYENVKVLGQVGGSMVCVIDNGHSDIYAIQKKKYTDKAEYTYLDSGKVRSTSWEEPYTNEAMAEQSMYNAYYGH